MLGNFPFSSNSSAASPNQHYFESDGERVFTSRAYFRIDGGGEFNYSLLFSGVHDSSYRKISMANQRCDDWEIYSAKVSRCPSFPCGLSPEAVDPEKHLLHSDFIPLTFGGATGTHATPGFFSTDPVKLSFERGEFLCLELTYSGTKIPCAPEILIPIYTKEGGKWTYTVNMPLPCMIGCDRAVKGKIAFIGDSITQGVETTPNGYKHWTALMADKLYGRYSLWNLGIGFGKASDAATDSIWLAKAKNCDTVFVCFGVNDVNGDYTQESIEASLRNIVRALKESGCRVILQTVPPYNHTEKRLAVWNGVNAYIKGELSRKCDRIFDVCTVLSGDRPEETKFGGHPSDEGCALWADALYRHVEDMF